MQDPIGSFEQIRELYLSYLDTAFRIAEPGVAAERRWLLRQPGAMCTDPLVEPIPRYEPAEFGLDDMVRTSIPNHPIGSFTDEARLAFAELVLAGLFPSRLRTAGEAPPAGPRTEREPEFRPYAHQLEMLRRGVQSGTPGIVTSGTGSGKTESFLLPIFAQLAKEAVKWPAPADNFLKRRWWHDEAGKPFTKKNKKGETVVSYTAIPAALRASKKHPRRSPFRAHRDGEKRPAAVRALILYPMNALVEDQMVRLRKALDSSEARAVMSRSFNGNRIFFGRYTGKAPVTGHHDHPGLRALLDKSEAELAGQSTYFPDHKYFDEDTESVALGDVRKAEVERKIRRITELFDFMVDAEAGQRQARLFALDAAASERLEAWLQLMRDEGQQVSKTAFLNHAKAAGKRQPGELAKAYRKLFDEAPAGEVAKALRDLELSAADSGPAASAFGEDAPFLFPSTDGSELISRWDMQAQPPDILVTNVSMLSAMLNREVDAPIFSQTRDWLERDEDACFFLVLDELHLQRGTAGTEVSYLLRLLLSRLGLDSPKTRHKVRILASSASLPDDPEDKAQKSAEFLWDMFGDFGVGSVPSPAEAKDRWRKAIVSGRQIAPRYDPKTPPRQLRREPFLEFLRAHELDSRGKALALAEALPPGVNDTKAAAWRSVAKEVGIAERGELVALVRNTVEEVAERISLACWEPEAADPTKGRYRAVPVSELAARLFRSTAHEDPGAIERSARALLFVRGAADGLGKWLGKGPPFPSFRLHTFFRSIEGLYAPAVPNAGITDPAFHRAIPVGRLSIEREQRLLVPDASGNERTLRLFEMIYCEACGELFFAGMRAALGRNSGYLAELLPHEPRLDGLPDQAASQRFEDLSYDQYAVFWPREQDAVPDKNDGVSTWSPAALEVETGGIRSITSRGLSLQEAKAHPKLVVGRYYERAPKHDRHKRGPSTAGSNVPFGCPACGTSYARRSREMRLSPIRNFRAGFGKTTQILATELFNAQRAANQSAQPKLVSFSDSRQDAAKAALSIEKNHHQDLRRELLVLTLRAAARNKRTAQSIQTELDELTAEIATAAAAGNMEGLTRLGERGKRLRAEYEAASEPAVALNSVLESSNLVQLSSRGLAVRPYVAALVSKGIHPYDEAGLARTRGVDADKDKWFEWTSLFSVGDELRWLDDDGPATTPNGDAVVSARTTLVKKVLGSLVDVIFSRTYFSFEESGLGYVCLPGAKVPKLNRPDDWPRQLSAFIRVLADAYRFDPNPYQDDNDEEAKPWTSFAEVTTERVKAFANASWGSSAKERVEQAFLDLASCGHPNGIVQVESLSVRLVDPTDRYLRCPKCGRIHLHLGTGYCTRCYASLANIESREVSEIHERNFLARRVVRVLDEAGEELKNTRGSFRLHCEELTGQTDDPAKRQREFKGIFVPEWDPLDDDGGDVSDADAQEEVAAERAEDFSVGELNKKRGEIDLLTVTTTMEVGIDIGPLQVVLQANMPPQRFNYQQRVGRAGRRGQAFSMALTICRTKSHDLYYFKNPKLITGDVPPTPFLTKGMHNIAKRFVRRAWLSAAFARLRDEARAAGTIFPADLMSPPDIHGEFLPASFWPVAGPDGATTDWRTKLEAGLLSTTAARDEAVSAVSAGAKFQANDVNVDAETLLRELDEARTDTQVDGLAHAVAERGWLPMYGMPTRVRELYLQLKWLSEAKRREWVTVDRDLDLAIYEFAPGSSVVIDKREHLSVGFTPSLSEPRRAKGGAELVTAYQDDALGPVFTLLECGHCHAWTRLSDGTSRDLTCKGCGSVLDLSRARECRVPLAFRTNFLPAISQEDADSGVRHRSIQAEGKEIQLKEQRDFLGGAGQFKLGFDETTTTFRINRGPVGDDGQPAFRVVQGTDTYPHRKIELPNQVVSTEARLQPKNFQPSGSPRSIWLAAPKVTDAIYMLPTKIAEGLSLHRLPAKSEQPVEDEQRWLGVRAAALSATYLVVNRAALYLDVDPEEFDVMEPRIYGEAPRAPLLQFTDHLVNGAGFSRMLFGDGAGKAPVSELIRSMLEDAEEYPRVVLEHSKHRGCSTACYRCLLRYGNQPFHGLLDWQLGLVYLRSMVDPSFQCGLDGDFSAPGLVSWLDNAKRLAEEMKDRFGGWTASFGGLPAFSLKRPGNKRTPWVLVFHPLWDWGEKPAEGSLPAMAMAEALADPGSADAVPLAWDTFNLERRQVLVRELVRSREVGAR